MLTVRCAQPDDNLTALWPETDGHTLNREQVFLAIDEAGAILAGLLMFHGGHTIAYAGSIVFATPKHQGRIAYRLLVFVTDWCRAHGIRLLGHGAGTVECCQTFLRLGATITRQQTLLEVAIPGGGFYG